MDFLATYTQNFAVANISRDQLDTFYLDSRFNYTTETFESVEYTLPYIFNKKRLPEFVLLTPRDILRKDEPTINRLDLFRSFSKVRNIIDDASIRSQLENYIMKAVAAYEKECKDKKQKIKEFAVARIEKQAFIDALQSIPELYDYYVKLKESEKDTVNIEAFNETLEQLEKFYINSAELIKLYNIEFPTAITGLSAREEAKRRLLYFKHIIEHCDGYKNLYYQGQPISKEDDLQRLFRFAWYGSIYDVNYETNNGRGESDIKVSYGAKEKNIVEFKLTSNPRLSHIFEQVAIYEQANQCTDSIYAIFYFNEIERIKVKNMLNATKTSKLLDESIFLIDCRRDNKQSAFQADAHPLE